MDADPDPSIFIIDLQYANKKLILKISFPAYLLFEGTFTSFFKYKKVKKKSKNSKNQGFFLSRAGSGSGSIPDSVLRIRDVYPGSRILIFTHPGSPIPDPKTGRKERGEKKIFVKHFFVTTNFTKC